MLRLSDAIIIENPQELSDIPEGKVLINCINGHSYNVAQQDDSFAEALTRGGYLIPDGASIVLACRWLGAKSRPQQRIAGWDLFAFEMQRLNHRGGKCLFMGSTEHVLQRITQQAAHFYPNIEVLTYSPPFKPAFSDEDSQAMISAINSADPDLLWIGMTAPKQEKWIFTHWDKLHIHCHVGTIGAVFDFFAGTERRAPMWWQKHALEWLYRLANNPRRMWRRSIIGHPLFLWNIIKEKTSSSRRLK